jgi:voltage-gated potassium channel
MANIREAMAAIIFADDSVHDSVLGDGKTLLFVSAVEHYAPNVYTVVEILKQEHIKNFKHVKVDEFVLSHEMISRLLVRSTFQKGITNIFSQLLSRSLGEDIYEISKKPHWQTYRDAVEELMDVGATLLGEGNKLNVNARLDEVIKEDATLRVICSKETFSKIKS